MHNHNDLAVDYLLYGTCKFSVCVFIFIQYVGMHALALYTSKSV